MQRHPKEEFHDTPVSTQCLAGGLAAAGLVTARSTRTLAQATAAPGAPPSYPFTVPPLGYGFAANEPSIDAQTMELHHDKHHAAYVANLNAALKDYPQVAAMPLLQILGNIGQVPEAIRTAVRNNGGGHANHSMFWQLMGGKGGAPEGVLAEAVDRDFGSLDKLKEAFNKAGAGVFGSGWVMVLAEPDGKLSLVTPAKPGFAADGRQARGFRQRRVGTRLLPEIPKPPAGISRCLVERA